MSFNVQKCEFIRITLTTLLFTESSSLQAKQNNFLFDTEKRSFGCCFTRCSGVINFGLLEQMPLDHFLPFGGWLQ